MKFVKALCIFTFLCDIYFLLILAWLHFVRADLNAFAAPVSYYRASPDSYYLSVGFIVAALAEMTLVALLSVLPGARRRGISKWGRSVLFLAAASFLVTGILKEGAAHWLGALSQMMLFPIAVMLISHTMKEGLAKQVSMITSVATAVVLLTLSQAFDNFSLFHPFFGLLEKIDIAIMMAWSAMILVVIYRLPLKSTFRES